MEAIDIIGVDLGQATSAAVVVLIWELGKMLVNLGWGSTENLKARILKSTRKIQNETPPKPERR